MLGTTVYLKNCDTIRIDSLCYRLFNRPTKLIAHPFFDSRELLAFCVHYASFDYLAFHTYLKCRVPQMRTEDIPRTNSLLSLHIPTYDS